MKKYFTMNFKDVSNKRLREYEAMVKEFSYLVEDIDPREIWDIFYRLGICIRKELHDREEDNIIEEKKNRNKRKSTNKLNIGKKRKMVIHKNWKKT